jgi:hypothetical protein
MIPMGRDLGGSNCVTVDVDTSKKSSVVRGADGHTMPGR